MANLFIAEQGAMMRKSGRRILIEKDGQELVEIELHRLDTAVLYGNIQFSTQTLKALMRSGVEVALLSQSGKLYGQVTPPAAKNILLRKKQFDAFGSQDFCLAQSKKLMEAKFHNSLNLMKQLRWNNNSLDVSESIGSMKRQLKLVDSADSSASLNGIEGYFAKAYFKGYGTAFKDKFLFNGRTRRPPKDQANSLLSFGYVLLGSIIQAHLDAVGFDPYLGFYHKTSYGRPSLGLDMLETFRAPIVDRFVLKMFNLGVFKQSDFEASTRNGYRLNENALRRFFARWDEHIETVGFRGLLRTQCDSLAKVCKGELERPEYYLFSAR